MGKIFLIGTRALILEGGLIIVSLMKRVTIADKNSLSLQGLATRVRVSGNASKNTSGALEDPMLQSFTQSQGDSTTFTIVPPFNPHLPEAPPANSHYVNIQMLPAKYSQPRRHMYANPAVHAKAINSRIDRLAARFLGGDDMAFDKLLVSPAHAFPSYPGERFMVIGQIVCDADARMADERCVLLEASRAIGSGARVRLDFSSQELLSGYSIFPGQIAWFEGVTANNCLIVHRQFMPVGKGTLPWPPIQKARLWEFIEGARERPTTIMISAGSYLRETEQLDYLPLSKILALASSRQPSVLILVGPLLDADHPAFTNGTIEELPLEIFRREIVSRLRSFCSSCPSTQIILVPSIRDLFHDFIFPQCAYQPPFTSDLPKNVFCASNPAMFFVNELLIGISSVDSLLSLSVNELARGNRTPIDITAKDESPADLSSVPPMDRITRLCSHLLEQRSFYPIAPAAPSINIDHAYVEAMEMPLCPHILVTPSQLKQFVRSVPRACINAAGTLETTGATVVINPGSATKRGSLANLGSVAYLTVWPAKIDDHGSKIMEDAGEMLQNAETAIDGRCRVDFLPL